jgi:hypothetical protein
VQDKHNDYERRCRIHQVGETWKRVGEILDILEKETKQLGVIGHYFKTQVHHRQKHEQIGQIIDTLANQWPPITRRTKCVLESFSGESHSV